MAQGVEGHYPGRDCLQGASPRRPQHFIAFSVIRPMMVLIAAPARRKLPRLCSRAVTRGTSITRDPPSGGLGVRPARRSGCRHRTRLHGTCRTSSGLSPR